MERLRGLELAARWGVALLALAVAALALQALVRAQPNETIVYGREEVPRRVIRVDVSGAVERPGVVTVQDGDRVGDAIARAGGVTADADLSAVNQAQRLRDEQQLVVPERGAAPRPPVPALIDLNRATARELAALPGIGDVRARAIVGWRDNQGPFGRSEDLVTHRLIPQSVFQAIRDRITVS